MPRSREPGTPCRLYVDGIAELRPGDFITTSGGSAYLVQSMRQSPSRPARRYLDCIRWAAGEIPADARVWTIYWYRRPGKVR